MGRALVAVVGAGALALGACSSGGTSSSGGSDSTPTASTTPSSSEGAGSVEGAEGSAPGGEYVDPAADMPRFDSPTDFMTAPGLEGFWSTDVYMEPGQSCAGATPEEGVERDPMTGDRVPYKELTCWAEGTEEEVTVWVFEGDKDVTIRAAASTCGPEHYAVTCFPGNGWVVHTLEVDTHVLPEVMDAIDVEVPEVEVPADSY